MPGAFSSRLFLKPSLLVPNSNLLLAGLAPMESTPFFIFLFIHLVGLILGFGSVLVTDLFGLLWIFNRIRFPQVVRVGGVTENFIWWGWGLMVAAGIPLIFLKGEIDNLMIIKLFFVALIGINGILLHRLQKKLKDYNQDDTVPNIVIFRLTTTLAVSQLGWWGAFTIGFLHRHVQSVIEWPAHPVLVCAGILAAIFIIWIAGEASFGEKVGAKLKA